MCLIPAVADACEIPVIAAGGIGDGRSMAAAFMLGAEAVQVGSRFVATPESSAHLNFKQRVVDAGEGETLLTLKELTPVRMLRNPFFDKVMDAYSQNADPETLRELLGRGRAKRGMSEGDMVEGELEIGQISGQIDEITPASEVISSMVREFTALLPQYKDL